jgi:hypothetical protein
MTLVKRIKTMVIVVALTVIAWSLFYLTASAAECFLVCPKAYICYLVCL